MNCCLETTIACCEALTSTSKEFVAAMIKTSGMTGGGISKHKYCARIIENRNRKEVTKCQN